MGLSMSPVLKSPRTSLASEPQMPARIGRVTHPVGTDEAGVVDVVQAEGDAGEHRLELVLWRGPDLSLVRRGAEQQCLHRLAPSAAPGSPRARMPTRKLSMSAVFASITAFMSGR